MRSRLFSLFVLTALLASATACSASRLRPSESSISYARELGGQSLEGETLYLLVGATTQSEVEAQHLLDYAQPLFGDMQSYFIVQTSDSFEGLEGGPWVVVEAYRKEPSPENRELGARAFPKESVQRVVVKTSDPIPVYEDLVQP